MLMLLIQVSLVVLVVGDSVPPTKIYVDPDTSLTGGVLDLSGTDLTTLYCEDDNKICNNGQHLEAQFASAVDQCQSRCNRNLLCLSIFYDATKICNLQGDRCTTDQLKTSTGTTYYRLKKGETCPSGQPPYAPPSIVYSNIFCLMPNKACPGYDLYQAPQNISPDLTCLQKCIKIKTCAGVDFNGKCQPKDYQCPDAELSNLAGSNNYMRLEYGEEDCPWNRAQPGQPMPPPPVVLPILPPAPSPASLDVYVCEGGNLVISCSGDQRLTINTASFGRSDRDHCSNGPIQTTTCNAGNSLSIVKSACQNQQSCNVGANNGVFGDPCSGTYKYLHVNYICVTGQAAQTHTTGLAPTDVVVCEGLNLNVVCPGDSVLIIHSASYGRTDTTQCATGPILTTSCAATDSLSIVKEFCEYKNTCVLGATNAVFDDPCFGTYKYLAVNYECIEQPDWRDVIACEGSSISISCPGGQELNIYSASYGRTEGAQCGNGPILTTSCRADTSFTVVSGACNGKQSCNVGANNGVFGDPCYGTYKYLAVRYSCE